LYRTTSSDESINNNENTLNYNIFLK